MLLKRDYGYLLPPILYFHLKSSPARKYGANPSYMKSSKAFISARSAILLIFSLLALPVFFAGMRQSCAAPTPEALILHKGGLAMHGQPALPDDFTHLPYADPNAVKGGEINYGALGTFDGLNPFVLRGFRSTARGLFADSQFGSMVFETLMKRSQDEPFTLYPLLAESYSLNDERSAMCFNLNPAAHFSDGAPVTADDILFSYNMLKDKGRPPYDSYMKRIASIKKTGRLSVCLTFDAPINRELPLIIASSMPILPHHALTEARFAENNLTPILGSGPYQVSEIDAGQMIVYKRDANYWGRNLPVNRGFNNFDIVKIHYFRNENALFEAFKKGDIDVFPESNANRWRTGYDFPAVSEGRIVRSVFQKGTPPNMMGFVFNTRRPVFAGRRVRRALSLLFDFNWVNRNFYDNVYKRTEGFWDNTPLSSVGHPADSRERALLAPYPNLVNDEIMQGRWRAPSGALDGANRLQAEKAWEILQQAGFTRRDNQIYMPNGKLFQFEIMCQNLEEEKLALAYQRFLAKIGISADVRTVDDTQYQNRLSNFDYDMIIGKLTASLSPGVEQINRWASISRDIKGSFNYAGANEPAIDAVINSMLEARGEQDFESSVRTLDRILISQHYYLPLYHLPGQWLAYSSALQHPAKIPLYGYQLPTWCRKAK